jgi:hypothetical protein
MENDELKKIIALLDSKIPREGAQVKLHQYGGGPDESAIVANSAGYSRLGIEFLKAAFAVPRNTKEPNRIPLDLSYLITEDSDVWFDSFERREDLFSEKSRLTTKDRVIQITFAGLLLGTIALALVGVVTLLRPLVS